MGLTNSQKRKFDNEQLQVQYDSYIAKKLQEEEQLRYEKLKKIEQDDFEFAKRLQEEEEKKLSSQAPTTTLSGQYKVIDLSQNTTNTPTYNTNTNNTNPSSLDNKVSHRSPVKQQKPTVKKENKKDNGIIGSGIIRKRGMEDEKSIFEINKKVKIEKDNNTNTKNNKIESKIGNDNIRRNKIDSHTTNSEKNKTIEQQNAIKKNVLSNYNLNHRPKKEITNSLADIRAELVNNKIQHIKTMGGYSNGGMTNLLKNSSPNKNIALPKSLPTVNSLLKNLKTSTTKDNPLLSDNNNNNNNNSNSKALVKNKKVIPIEDNLTNEFLIEQLQREEVLINSLSDQPFLPPTSNAPLDKVQQIIQEQERLLQEYNRKRKGKEKDESPVKSVVPVHGNSYGVSDGKALKKFNVRNIHELDDPCPDLHQLFLLFNAQYFHHKLDSVEVRWSKRMTLCAGICYYYPGGYCSVRLSEPLLKFRTRDDFINTLLHEMIHAYLFLTEGNKDHDGHGESFHRIMYKLNRETGSNITVYHNFHNEVNHYRTHVWRCNGPCRNRPPFFGYVRRSMNRKPQKADHWWRQHQMTCGGEFIKISEPEEYTRKRLKKQQKDGNTLTINNALLNQPSTSNLDTFKRLKTINTTISKPKPTITPKPTNLIKPTQPTKPTSLIKPTNLVKPTNPVKPTNLIKPTKPTKPTLPNQKPKIFHPGTTTSPRKPDLPFRTKIFDPRTKREFDGGGRLLQVHTDSEMDDGTNDFSPHKPTTTRRPSSGTSGSLFGHGGSRFNSGGNRGSNIHGFGSIKKPSSSSTTTTTTTTTTKSGSNIHGFGSLKKTNTTSRPGSNIHGFDSFRTTNTTPTISRPGSNIHGFGSLHSSNSNRTSKFSGKNGSGGSTTFSAKKKKNTNSGGSIIDFLKRKK